MTFVLRNGFAVASCTPMFINEPYQFNVTESTKVGTIVGSVIAVDPVLQVTMAYNLTGDSAAMSLFSVDTNSGEIKLLKDLRQSPEKKFNLHIIAFIALAPDEFATTTASVSKLSNDNDPIFFGEPYYLSLFMSTPVNTIVYTISANDADGDIIRYSLLDTQENEIGKQYFGIQPYTGAIYLKKALVESSFNEISLYVQASDQGIPERVDYSIVKINIRLDHLHDIISLQTLNKK